MKAPKPTEPEDDDPLCKIISLETGKEVEFLRHSLSDAHQKALGDVVAQHNYLEDLMRDLIHRALGVDHGVGDAVTDRMPMSKMIGLARALLYQRFPEDEGRAEVDRLLKEVDAVRPERNEDIHAKWAGGDGRAFRLSWNRGKAPAYKVVERKPSEMHDFANEIGRVCYSVMKFILRYYQRVPDPAGEDRRPGEPRRGKKK